MRVQGVVFFIAAFAATETSGSSIEVLQPSAGSPSIVTIGEETTIDPSIVAATPTDGPTPSIVVLANTPAGDTPSIIALGGPSSADENVAAGSPASAQRMATPMVFRGGEAGTAAARSTPPPAKAATEPLLDPNDRGTPAKRKALKRQAERLAQEAAEAAKNPQPDPSTEPVPLGQ